MAGPARLTREDVAHVAALARLHLSEEELDLLHRTARRGARPRRRRRLPRPGRGRAPTAHALAVTNVLRPTSPAPCLDRDEVLAQAPSVEDHRFRVPRILGEAP